MKRGRHADGRYGLYFNVIGNSRTWVQRLTIDGKRRNFGLGPWPVVSLSEARGIAFDNVRKRHCGIDPIAERRRAAAMPTFAEALDSCIALRAGGWKAGSRNEANWRSSLAHAAPIADRPVDAIVCDDVDGPMTKSELIERIAQAQSHLVERDVALAVNMMLDHIATCLSGGGRIEIRGFGSFSLRFRHARVGRNPRTGTPLSLPARYAPYFKPGKECKLLPHLTVIPTTLDGDSYALDGDSCVI